MRWVRLNIDFDDSPWLFVLSAESQLAWIKLLCHMKRDGIGGTCKALAPLVAAKKWGVGDESVVKMLQAAVADGALVIDGKEWTLTNWNSHQETDMNAALRMRRHRERKQKEQGEDVTPVTRNDRNVTRNTRNACRVTETETETETRDTSGEVPLKEKLKKEKRFDPLSVDLSGFKPNFSKEWANWVGHRTDIGKPLTERSVAAQLAELSECEDPVGVVRRAVAGSWQGLNVRPEDKTPRNATVGKVIYAKDCEEAV